MGKNRNESNKVNKSVPGKTKKVPFKAKTQKQKDPLGQNFEKSEGQNRKTSQSIATFLKRSEEQADGAKFKPKPAQQRQNQAAELRRKQKEAEKAEKERRIKEFKKKRSEKTKVLNKKTSRGQPLMKNRIEYLLKQIQEMKNN